MINDIVERIRWFKPKILIVDDMLHNIKLLNSFFDLYKIDVIPAYNAMQALEIVNTKKPDIVLLDISMPEIDGFDLCKRIKDNPDTKDIPIIFLTAKNNLEDVLRGFENGGSDYITKPFNPQELLARVFAQLEIKYSKETIKQQNDELIQTRNALFAEAMKVVALNEQVYDSEAMLKNLNAAKDKLFSIIAHDLKSPLSTLKTQIEMMADYYADLTKEDVLESLQLMKESSNMLFSLLENLLMWSRSQLGKIEYNPDMFFINYIINDSLYALDKKLKAKNLTVNNKMEEIELFFDPFLLSFVFKNLLSNAIKFSKNNQQIDVYIKEKDSDFVKVAIKDYGYGMDSDTLSQLFKLDAEGAPMGIGENKGTGLGLILCKEFIQMHGGKIQAFSEPDKGSEFVLLIPVVHN